MREKDHLVLTATGPDRVGLVEKLAECIARYECNIEDSKMATFCGEFAIIMLISGDRANIEQIAGNAPGLEAETGLTIRTRNPLQPGTDESIVQMKLTASCMDHPGIVYRISRVLRGFGVNIVSMETTTYAAPVSGSPLFQLQSRITATASLNIEDLRDALDAIQYEENIDIDLRT
jgi:glycine cleavage system transcriptional repressor